MTVNTQEIRELLEKATPGPWAVRYDYVVQAPSFDDGRLVPVAQPYGVNSDGTDLFANARLIAACDPDTIRALLDERDALEVATKEASEVIVDRTGAIRRLREAPVTPLSGARAEMAGSWRCSSCHPRLMAGMGAADAALAPDRS